MVPKFEVDPEWPKPLPNNWVIGSTIGLSADSHDNIWIIHRPATLAQKESYSKRGEADCCQAAPDVWNQSGRRADEPLGQGSGA